MWVPITFTAIALIGTAFMVWFFLGLLRERGPSVCYLIVPARRRPQKERHLAVLHRIYAGKDCSAPEGKRSDYYVELLENEVHAEECASGLIALDDRPMPANFGWRAIRIRPFRVFDERRR